jgi:hypothetical protein
MTAPSVICLDSIVRGCPETALWPIRPGTIARLRANTLRRGSASRSRSHVIAGMFMAIFEGELGDAGFVELTEAFRNHAIVLLLGGAGEW